MDNATYRQFVMALSQTEYGEAAKRLEGNGLLINAAFSLAGEAGELVDAIKKHLFYGKALDLDNVKEELGDMLFYINMAANALGVTVEDLQKLNYEKLIKRYPSGTFNAQDAIKRADKT